MTHTAIAPLHVIVGAGQVGPFIAERLLAQGLRVRLVRRGSFESTPAGAEPVRADASDPAQAKEALRGASVVYHTGNPRYHRWSQELLPLARGILAGTSAAGARLVVLDNLYSYEVPSDGRLTETTRVAPSSKKGALRAEAAALLLDAHARGEAPVAIVRGSDWVGPGVHNSVLGERFWTKLFAGKAVELMAGADHPHTYTYAPDAAAALVTLGLASDDAYGQVWHAPALPAETTRAWMGRFAELAGRPLKTQVLTPFVLRVAGLFMPEAVEIPEMMYQWQTPFILDDAKFRRRFGSAPTDQETVVRETFAWAAARFGAPHRRAARVPTAASAL
ncbi:MAG TPA: NAD-dependent epimerase/dehydratase family protein [Polyangiaceae bacterium]|nr:NAD-dependent epimerase/dehydratase family protein [Polyangiaceae bacterium]